MVNKWAIPAQYLLYPPTCLLCRARGHDGLDICPACHQELPWRTRPGGSHREPGTDPVCHVDEILTPFDYAYPVDQLIKRFKYDADLPSGRLLGDLLGRWAAPRVDGDSLLIPVPSTRRRLAERGFEPPAFLAGRLARRLPADIARDALVRRRDTPKQSELPARQRRRNLRHAFSARRLRPACRHGIIVDDVVTTGTTAKEAGRAVRKGEFDCIRVLAVARA